MTVHFNKLFLPAGATVASDDAVRLSDGQVLPAWPFIAVPFVDDPGPRPSGGSTVAARRRFVDLVTGVLTSVAPHPQSTPTPTSFPFDVGGFTRVVDLADLVNSVRAAMPSVTDRSGDESDPGYLDSAGAKPVATVDAGVTGYDGGDEYDFGDGVRLSDLLRRGRAPQTLADTEWSTRTAVVTSLAWIAENVLKRVDSVGQPLRWSVWSGYVSPSEYSPYESARFGRSVRLEFVGTDDQIYVKARALARALPHDRVSVDYRSNASPLVTLELAVGSQTRLLSTRYDDRVVSPDRLIHAVRGTVISDNLTPVDSDFDGVTPDEADDYSSLVSAIASNVDLFGGKNAVNALFKSLGLGPSGLLSSFGTGASGSAPASLTGSDARNAVSGALTCPPERTDPRLFPTATNPAMRSLTDVSQLDDKSTQDTVPYPLRTNNPMKVKKVEGVTDLKTRFGYLGEVEGVAVYRDHVGGAAAGINYVLSTSGGKTMAAATKNIMGPSLDPKSPAALASKAAGDATLVTAGKVHETVGRHVFGVADPTGATQQCATIKPDDMDSTINYCAAVAKAACGTEANPLTHAEWASAYQIAKNEPNGHLKKTTTGVDLPAQEESNTVDTGVMTVSQAKDTRNTTDYDKRAAQQTWNPTTNYPHYSTTLWGANGANWIARGLVNYQQKESADDVTRMAKKYDSQEMNQDTKHPTSTTMLDWTPGSSSG